MLTRTILNPLPATLFDFSPTHGRAGCAFPPGTCGPCRVAPFVSPLPLTSESRTSDRRLLAGGLPPTVLSDAPILAVFPLGLMFAGTVVFRLALDYARRCGTLAQY
jgi:hypothetical protein